MGRARISTRIQVDSRSELILVKETGKHTNWMGKTPQILGEIFARIQMDSRNVWLNSNLKKPIRNH